MSGVAEMVGLLGKGKGCKFASVIYRTKRNNELAKYMLVLGAKTHVLYEKDIAALEAAFPTLKTDVEKQAALELLNSRKESLTQGIGHNSLYTCEDVYVNVDGIPGVKVHKETGVAYVTGLCESKTVLEAGDELPPVKSSAKTIAKNKLRETYCKSDRFRQFIIKRIGKLSANGEVLEIEVAE